MAFSLYIDPTSWVFIVGFSILSKNAINSAIEIASTFALSAVLMFVSGNFNEQIRNSWNILTLADHSENIGIFFYISIEVFLLHIWFFIIAYLVYDFVCLMNYRQLWVSAYDIIQITTEYDEKKRESREFRLKVNMAYLIMFLKVVFNQYPLLFDYNQLLFLLVCCNMRLASKYIEGQIAIMFILGYSGCMTFYMWSAWLQSFQGNANFFYFQTIVFNIGLVIINIQIFQAVSTKTYK